MRNSIKGNTATEYLICMAFVLTILVAGNGIFGDGSFFGIFKNTYDLFMNRFNATVLNLDAIP
ncbi:hypothetical protein ACG59Z_17575 [Acinetobacter sp. ABJ_C1_1]|uniref:hypothetical protein n=1 Tax=unclassified Acinetobacter TaxID=196816 RepID=UPI003008C0F9